MSQQTANTRSRRSFVKGLAGVGGVGITGFTGYAARQDSYSIGFANMGLAGDPWLKSFQNGAKWYANDKGMDISITDAKFDPAKQIRDARRLMRQGVDGLVISPLDSKALAKVVDQATSRGIPVFTANSTAFSENVRMFTAFGNANAASVAGDLMVEQLTERYGEPRGKVVEVLMPQKAKTFVQRHEGFFDRIGQESNIEIVSQIQVDEASVADVTNKMSTQLQKSTEFDAIYCPDLTSELGTLAALENEGAKKKIGEDGHIIMTGIDAGPNILTAIQNEYMEAAVDQPNLFYGPISIKYMVDYLNAGKDASVLPDMGTKVTTDDLTIQGNKHVGVDPWQKQIWAPANVQELSFEGGSQRFFQTKEVVVTKDNADAPYLWGNIAKKY